MALVQKLQAARAYQVRDWNAFVHEIPPKPGAYRFTGADGLRVYVGETDKSLRERLRKQVMPARIGKRWTLRHPPPAGVCRSRNLLGNVLKDQRDGRRLAKPPEYTIDTGDVTVIEALNAAFHTIDGLTVQWVGCPVDLTERVEHLADRCIFDRRCRCEDDPRPGSRRDR